eukprot:GHVQ01007516.1.p1 GENE.GHVQ01007516.1~~GHVQ01007516.1.p1  ORF type:complete len:291 (+),score=72.34 GHVQ01007516.1:60-932(+)
MSRCERWCRCEEGRGRSSACEDDKTSTISTCSTNGYSSNNNSSSQILCTESSSTPQTKLTITLGEVAGLVSLCIGSTHPPNSTSVRDMALLLQGKSATGNQHRKKKVTYQGGGDNRKQHTSNSVVLSNAEGKRENTNSKKSEENNKGEEEEQSDRHGRKSTVDNVDLGRTAQQVTYEAVRKLGRLLAMQAVCAKPRALNLLALPTGSLRAEEEYLRTQSPSRDSELSARILRGKLIKYITKNVLVEQDWRLDDSGKSVRDKMKEWREETGIDFDIEDFKLLGIPHIYDNT